MNYEVIYYVLFVTLLGITLHTHSHTLTLSQLVIQRVPVVSPIDNSLRLSVARRLLRHGVHGSLYRAYENDYGRHAERLDERERPCNDSSVTQHSGHAEQ
jgi:hypothetical protein